ncbi:MAG: vitamin K epoxide reductase family protein [Patescibacteria group bacterium]
MISTSILARRSIFFLSLAGLFVSLYLLIVYTSGNPIVCGPFHGCDTVRSSQWANFYGIPTPAFGVLFYFVLAMVASIRTASPMLYPKLARVGVILLGFAGLIESAVLTGIEAFVLHAYCAWCVASAIISTLIFFVCWFDKGWDALDSARMMTELKFQFFAFALFVLAGGAVIILLMRAA